MPEYETLADDSAPTEPNTDETLTRLAGTNDPATLLTHDEVPTEVVERNVGPEQFEQNQEWNGIVMCGLTNDAGELLLVYDDNPETHHEWVLPHGVVQHDDDWLDTATDWVDGLTGITPEYTDVVHIRRNRIVLETDPSTQTTTYHVFLSGSPKGSTAIAASPRYDRAVDTAGWHNSIPETGRAQEYEDIALFHEHTESNTQMQSTESDAPKTANVQVSDPAELFEHDDVTTEVVEIEADAEHFERYQDWRGMAIAGVTNDDGEVLLAKNNDPDICHDWVLPDGAVSEDHADWADIAADWVDGLTGVAIDINDVVLVRRNDITVELDYGAVDETTTYHVIFSARPRGSEEIKDEVRYDCDDVWTAGWHESIPASANETESADIALFFE